MWRRHSLIHPGLDLCHADQAPDHSLSGHHRNLQRGITAGIGDPALQENELRRAFSPSRAIRPDAGDSEALPTSSARHLEEHRAHLPEVAEALLGDRIDGDARHSESHAARFSHGTDMCLDALEQNGHAGVTAPGAARIADIDQKKATAHSHTALNRPPHGGGTPRPRSTPNLEGDDERGQSKRAQARMEESSCRHCYLVPHREQAKRLVSAGEARPGCLRHHTPQIAHVKTRATQGQHVPHKSRSTRGREVPHRSTRVHEPAFGRRH